MDRLKRINHPTKPVSRYEDIPEYQEQVKINRPIDHEKIKLRQRFMESGFDDKLVSNAGAMGRYQIMPSTGDEYTNLTGKTGDLMDPKYNEQVRDYYVNKRLPQFPVIKNRNSSDSSRVAQILAAYVEGPGNLERDLKKLEEKGVDIDNSLGWVDSLKKAPRDYVNFILSEKDIDKFRNNTEFEKAKKKHGLK